MRPLPGRTKAEKRYVLFFKPYGVVSQFTPVGGHSGLGDFDFPEGIYPAGRLDQDSEGLLLLTDDGALKNRLCDPRFGHPRTYWAQVDRIIDESTLEKLANGVVLNDGPTRQCKAKKIQEPDLPPRNPPIRFRKTVPTSWVQLTLTEGRNRQVRRMLAAVGFPVLRLVRAGTACLRIEGLKPGQWRHLSASELKYLGVKRNKQPPARRGR